MVVWASIFASMEVTVLEAELRVKKAVYMFPLEVPICDVGMPAAAASRARSSAVETWVARTPQSDIRYFGETFELS